MNDSGEKKNEVKLTGSGAAGRNAWMQALAELENSGATPIPVRPPSTRPAKPETAPASKVRTVTDDLEELRSKLDAVKSGIGTFVSSHPYLIAPNVYRMWEENMQESCVAIDRQLRQRPGGGA
ncbi:hypothetical protein GC173_15220 [bacterium]|nr:hypothetical protein [bacterium]